jgi:hypothetical protein
MRAFPRANSKVLKAKSNYLRSETLASSPLERISAMHPYAREQNRQCYTRTIITSIELMRAAAVWPLDSSISRAASAVMMEVIC